MPCPISRVVTTVIRYLIYLFLIIALCLTSIRPKLSHFSSLPVMEALIMSMHTYCFKIYVFKFCKNWRQGRMSFPFQNNLLCCLFCRSTLLRQKAIPLKNTMSPPKMDTSLQCIAFLTAGLPNRRKGRFHQNPTEELHYWARRC